MNRTILTTLVALGMSAAVFAAEAPAVSAPAQTAPEVKTSTSTTPAPLKHPMHKKVAHKNKSAMPASVAPKAESKMEVKPMETQTPAAKAVEATPATPETPVTK